MTKLIKISKPGHPDLEIHPDALEQHQKLGWSTGPSLKLKVDAAGRPKMKNGNPVYVTDAGHEVEFDMAALMRVAPAAARAKSGVGHET